MSRLEPTGTFMSTLPAATIVDGRYKIVKLLAEGGMGAVYLAIELEIDRQVALKLIHPELASTEFRQRFKLEAEVLNKLSHKNIVQIYRYGIWKEQIPYLAMELLEGFSLRDLL